MSWNAHTFQEQRGNGIREKTLEFESVCDLSRRQYNTVTCSMFVSSQVRLSAVLSPLVRGSVSVWIQFPISWAQGFCHSGQRGKRSRARPTLYTTESVFWSYSYISSPGGVPSKLICGSQGCSTVIDTHTATAIWDLLTTRYCHPWNLLSLCLTTSSQLGGT